MAGRIIRMMQPTKAQMASVHAESKELDDPLGLCKWFEDARPHVNAQRESIGLPPLDENGKEHQP